LKSCLVIFGKPRYLGLIRDDGADLAKGMEIIVSSARGDEIGVVAGPITDEQAESYRTDLSMNGADGAPRGGEPAFQDVKFVRVLTPEDRQERILQEEEEIRVLVKGRELLKAHDLEMKLVDVEYLLDRKKLFFYFTAEQRVDFRAYVRDLAKEFRTRIELRQIGVRDESKVVKGISPCGMPCCCSYWLNRFAPICIRMVKEQNLALNPTKISGICGRLMCCMGYEHDTYREIWKNLPSPGSKIKTPSVNYVVSGIDVAARRVRVTSPGSGEMLVDVDDFQEFREKVTRGEIWEEKADLASPLTENLFEAGIPDSVPEECDDKAGDGTVQPVDVQREGRQGERPSVPEAVKAPHRRRRKKKSPDGGNGGKKNDQEVQSKDAGKQGAEDKKGPSSQPARSNDRRRSRRRRPRPPKAGDSGSGK